MSGTADLSGRPVDGGAPAGALVDIVRRTGASAGGVYLLDESAGVIGLALLCGVPVEVVWPYRRVPLSASTPASDAVRDEHLVWVGSQEELARVYPRTAASLPYRFALAVLPLRFRGRCRGGLMLLWPASHPPEITRRERTLLKAAARSLARVLDEARPAPLPDQPLLIPAGALQEARSGQPLLAARDYLDRMPEAALGLDLEGRITFAAGATRPLLGLDVERLRGTRPWQSLPWLDTAAVEDHYRTAVISRDPVAFTALRPPDRPLRFELYPDASGISVRVTGAAASVPGSATAPPGVHPPPHPTPQGPSHLTRPGAPPPSTAPAPSPDPSPAPPPSTAPAPSPDPAPPPSTVPAPSRAVPPRAPPAGPGAAAHAGRLYQLVHLAAALTETVVVRDVVDLLAHQVLPAFGADGLVLSAADAGRLRITGYHGYDQRTIDRLDGLPLDTDVTPAGRSLSDGTARFFAGPGEMALEYPDAPRLSGKQAWAFLPLIISGRPVGCCILSYSRPHHFSADERAVLTSLAGLIAQALDRARLYDTTRELARGLQQTLLPRRLPRVPGLETAARYLPASHGMNVGGDFYDLIRVDDTTAAAVIGDVQGHNVEAAALMGQVRTAILAAAGAPPDQVLARTDRVLADLESELLVSCLYVHIDLERRRAVLASAGHPPPLLHRAGRAGTVVELDPGPLLGIHPGLAFPLVTLELHTGTSLVLYTDGLVETPGTDADHVARDLAGRLAGHTGDPLGRTLDGLLHHARPAAHYTDDIALLLLRIATA